MPNQVAWRGLLGPFENRFRQAIWELEACKAEPKIGIPKGVPLQEMAWAFKTRVKLLVDCNREELLEVVADLVKEVQTRQENVESKAASLMD